MTPEEARANIGAEVETDYLRGTLRRVGEDGTAVVEVAGRGEWYPRAERLTLVAPSPRTVTVTLPEPTESAGDSAYWQGDKTSVVVNVCKDEPITVLPLKVHGFSCSIADAEKLVSTLAAAVDHFRARTTQDGAR